MESPVLFFPPKKTRPDSSCPWDLPPLGEVGQMHASLSFPHLRGHFDSAHLTTHCTILTSCLHISSRPRLLLLYVWYRASLLVATSNILAFCHSTLLPISCFKKLSTVGSVRYSKLCWIEHRSLIHDLILFLIVFFPMVLVTSQTGFPNKKSRTFLYQITSTQPPTTHSPLASVSGALHKSCHQCAEKNSKQNLDSKFSLSKQALKSTFSLNKINTH